MLTAQPPQPCSDEPGQPEPPISSARVTQEGLIKSYSLPLLGFEMWAADTSARSDMHVLPCPGDIPGLTATGSIWVTT